MRQNELRQVLFSVPDDRCDQVFARALRSIRTHLNMQVAFISEFTEGRRYFRNVDNDEDAAIVQVGASDPLEQSYCQRVVDGRLPELMLNAGDNVEACTLDATRAIPVGAHLSVPIRLSDGSVYGTFCCFSTKADYALNARDLSVMRAFSEVVAEQIEKNLSQSAEISRRLDRISAVLQSEALDIVYQPLFNLADGRLVGFEALSRFTAEPSRTPDVWFSEAASVGLGGDLECLAIRRALAALDHLPPWAYVAVNASPATALSGMLEKTLAGVALERVVVEITEHEAVDQYSDLSSALSPLQARGLRVAIDDAGAGYASFRHILNLSPHMIKLDISITRDVHKDRSRRALAAALQRFSQETDARIVAEGVESADELQMLRELGFDKAQGYFLGRPMPMQHAVALCQNAAGAAR